MGFLRRLLGGGSGHEPDAGGRAGARPGDRATLDAEERAHELELARFEQDRTDDLVRRQQRFAAMSWTPPAQGGERRSDDHGQPDPDGDGR